MTSKLNWLDTVLYGVRRIHSQGVELDERNTLDFTAPLTATDNPTTKRTDITLPIAGSTTAGTCPQTTGPDKVLTSPMGVPAWKWLKNVNIDNAAAIDGSKVVPTFGDQDGDVGQLVLRNGTAPAVDAAGPKLGGVDGALVGIGAGGSHTVVPKGKAGWSQSHEVIEVIVPPGVNQTIWSQTFGIDDQEMFLSVVISARDSSGAVAWYELRRGFKVRGNIVDDINSAPAVYVAVFEDDTAWNVELLIDVGNKMIVRATSDATNSTTFTGSVELRHRQ